MHRKLSRVKGKIRSHAVAVLVTAVVVGAASSARSAAVVWSGAGDASTWQSGTNWTGNAIPASGKDVQFKQTTYNTGGTIDVGGSFNLDSIEFGGTATTVTTPALTINNSVTSGAISLISANTTAATASPTAIWVANQQINPVTLNTNLVLAPSTGTQSTFAVTIQVLTVNGAISDNGAGINLNVTGAGAVALAGSNTFTGGTTVSSTGTLQLSASSIVSSGAISGSPVGTGSLSLNSGSTLQGNGIAQNIANAVNLSGTNNFAGSSGITIDGTGLTTPTHVTLTSATTTKIAPAATTLTINSPIIDNGGGYSLTKTGAGVLTLSGENTFSGGTTLSAGTLKLGASTFVVGGAIISSPVGTGLLTLNGGTLSDSANALTLANAVSVGGTVTLGNSTGSITINGSGLTNPTGVTLTNNTTLSIGDTATITSPIGDGGNAYALTKTGASDLKVAGVNTYTGATTVVQANLQLGANAPAGGPGTLGNSTAPVQVGTSTTPHASGAGLVTTAGVAVGRDISVYNISANPGYTGGVISLGGGTAQTTSTSTYTGQITLNGNANFQSSTTGSHVVDFQGKITGPGGVNKTAGGIVQIDNASNNYQGATSVTLGELLINGANVGGGSYSVNAGTLGGIGSIVTGSGNNGMTVASGAALAPGLLATGQTSGSGFTITGDTTINGTLTIEADSDVSSLYTSGVLTLGGTSTLTFAGSSNLTQLDYVIATYGPSELSGTFATINNQPGGYTIDYNLGGNNDIALVATSNLPEPTSCGFLGVVAVGLLLRRRFRGA